MRDVVDTASGNLNYVFDDVARICTTSAIRVCLLSFGPSLLTPPSFVNYLCGKELNPKTSNEIGRASCRERV